MSSPGTLLTPVPGLCLLFEFVAFGHSALSGCEPIGFLCLLYVWKYTEEVLLQQGSWKDPETLRRFYSGITDQTLAQAMAIHGWGGTDA